MLKRAAIAFPGQGTQQAGMLKTIWKKNEKIVGRVLEECDAALNEKFSQVLIDEQSTVETRMTRNTQPMLVTYGYAIDQVLRSQYPQENFTHVLGHSLGEYTAWCSAGIMKLSDAVPLVRRRAEAMQAATDAYGRKTTMTLMLLPRNSYDKVAQVLAPLLSDTVALALYNAENQLVLSGDEDHVTDVVATVKSELRKDKLRITTKNLAVSAPFHSQILAPGKEIMRELADKLELKWPVDTKVISNRSGEEFASIEEVRESIPETFTSPVRWMQSIHHLQPQVDEVFQVGEGKSVEAALSSEIQHKPAVHIIS